MNYALLLVLLLSFFCLNQSFALRQAPLLVQQPTRRKARSRIRPATQHTSLLRIPKNTSIDCNSHRNNDIVRLRLFPSLCWNRRLDKDSVTTSTNNKTSQVVVPTTTTNTIFSTVIGIMFLLLPALSSLVLLYPTIANANAADTSSIGWDGTVLLPCPTKTNSNCVSSSVKEPPNRYLSSLRTLKDQSIAFDTAVKDLQESNSPLVVIKESVPAPQYYIHIQVPGTAPNSLDDLEFQFTNAHTVNIRCQAQVTLPYAPFCLKKNCINGAQDQRDRVSKIALEVLGLPFGDESQMNSGSAKWTPIFFNADRVPGFEDNLNY